MLKPIEQAHPNGDSNIDNKLTVAEPCSLDTFGGNIHVEWDPQAAVTPIGQMPFFTEFLKTTNLFDDFVQDCPLIFFSNNASKKRDVLGTFLLSILSGYTRYAHITALRYDHVNPPLLGMSKVVSEDAARRAIKKIEEKAGCAWLQKHLEKSYKQLLSIPWVMDIDSTVKTLYGTQEGAEIGYNPTKPGRPSHSYHTYHIANIRMILDVEIQDGKSNAGFYSAPRLWNLLEELPKKCWPAFVRGDASYGNEKIMQEAEARDLKYLFKLKCTSKVKKLLIKMMKEPKWEASGQGWEGIASELLLSGWTTSRRVILLRRKLPKNRVSITKTSNIPTQLDLFFSDLELDTTAYEYQILVTNMQDEVTTLSQHYRDRADCENNFDELKNQWGWCGYTTQDLKRNKLMAKMTALIYNWWTIFTRLANPNSHLEAITSRPLLLNAVAKRTSHAGKTKVTITSTHSKAQKVSQLLAQISKFFSLLKSSAEQLTAEQKFFHILMTAFRKFIPQNLLSCPTPLLVPG